MAYPEQNNSSANRRRHEDLLGRAIRVSVTPESDPGPWPIRRKQPRTSLSAALVLGPQSLQNGLASAFSFSFSLLIFLFETLSFIKFQL
jgi:hypothetical protein